MTNEYYVYLYLREDGTPYYIGKGKGRRAYDKNRKFARPAEKERIVFHSKNLTEDEAFKIEKELIAEYGRKDIDTGILRNLTDGGEGLSGHIKSEEYRNNMSVAQQKLWDNRDLEFKASHSFAVKKALANPKIKAKQSARLKELWKDPEYRAEMTLLNKEVKKRPGMKERLSEKAKLNMADPEYKRRWKESINRPELKARQVSPENVQKRKDGLNRPEVKAKISARLKEKWKDPEYRLKISASRREMWAKRKAKKFQESANLTEFFILDPVSD